jgi:hypothetical protein
LAISLHGVSFLDRALENAARALFVALVSVLGIALPLPASAGAAPAVTEPELTLQERCGEFPGIRITLTGFPPNTPYTFTFQTPDGGQIGPSQLTSGPNGEFILSEFGSGTGTYTLTIEWSGGTLQESISVRCPITTADCRDGGWRQFGVFKNQGQCVAFLRRGPKGEPVIFLDAECPFVYGGVFRVSNLEPSTEYALRYLQPGGGAGWFRTNGVGAAQAGGANNLEPFEIGVRIWRDPNHDILVNDDEVVAIEAHFIVDKPCQDVFPESN